MCAASDIVDAIVVTVIDSGFMAIAAQIRKVNISYGRRSVKSQCVGLELEVKNYNATVYQIIIGDHTENKISEIGVVYMKFLMLYLLSLRCSFTRRNISNVKSVFYDHNHCNYSQFYSHIILLHIDLG